MASLVSPSMRAVVLARDVSSLELVLASNSEDWKPRVAAMARLEELMTAGLQAEGYDAFTDMALPLLTSLATALTTQLTDLRSEIVRQASHLVSFLALHLPTAFTKCATKLFPALLRVSSGTNGVMRAYAAPAALEVVQHVPHSSLLLDLLNELKTSKNKTSIGLCSQLLSLSLRLWSTRLLRKYAALVEESIVSLLSAADAVTRNIAGECALLYFDHFPARSKAVLQALDARATRIVNECRRAHVTAENVAPGGGKLRSDSVTSVESFAGGVEEEEKRPSTASFSRRESGSSSGGGPPTGRMTYGQKVDIVEELSSKGDVDDSTLGLKLQGRKGTVISHSQREGRTGEWVGVRLEAETPTEGEEEGRKPAMQKVVYVRPSTVRKEGWRISKVRAPPIDTSHQLKSPAPVPHSASSYKSSGSLPPSPAPSSASSAHATPLSARSNASSASAFSRLSVGSPVALRKSASSHSMESPQPTGTPPRSLSATPSSSSSTGGVAPPRLMSPPSSAGRSFTSPVTRIPTGNLQSAALSRTSVLPSSRIPVSPSRIPSCTPSRIPSRSHSRTGSGHFSTQSSPALSASASPSLPPTRMASANPSHVPTFSLTQPLPSTSSASSTSVSSSSSSGSALPALDFPSLLAMHRHFEAEVGAFSSALHAQLLEGEAKVSATADEAVDADVDRGYSDGMIRLMSEHLMRSTKVLEAFVSVKRKGLKEGQARPHTSDAFLESHDHFTVVHALRLPRPAGDARRHNGS